MSPMGSVGTGCRLSTSETTLPTSATQKMLIQLVQEPTRTASITTMVAQSTSSGS